MRLPISLILLIILVIHQSTVLAANAVEPLDNIVRLEIYKKAMEAFSLECLTADNQVKVDPPWCVDEYHRLVDDIKDIAKNVVTGTSEAVAIGNCQNCSESQPPIPPDMQKELAELAAEFNSCSEKEKMPVFSKQCMADISCNVFRMVVNPKGGMGICKNEASQKTNCFFELLNGIAKDVVFSLKGLFIDLPVLAGKALAYTYEKSKEAAAEFWTKMWAAEEASSLALVQTTHRSDESIMKIIKDKMGFVMAISAALMDELGKHIRESYGCEKWSGAPHVSKCVQPMSSFDCATCNQKMNAICGTFGILSGEIAAAYFTGGIFAVSKVLGSRTVQKAVAVNQLWRWHYGTASPAADRAFRFTAITGKSLAKVAKMTFSEMKKLYDLTMSMPLVKKMLSESNRRIVNGKEILASDEALKFIGKAVKAAGKPAIQVVRMGTYPISKYLQLMDHATKLGYRQGTNLFVLNQSSSQMTVAIMNPETIKPGDQIRLPGKTVAGREMIVVGDKKVYLRANENGRYVVIKEIK